MKNFSIFKSYLTRLRGLAVLTLMLFVIGIGNAWGTEGDELAVCQGTGSGYGTRRTLTDSHSVNWVLATGQSGYLGANNAANHNKVMPTDADLPVVKGVNSSATTSTTGYYFYYTSTAISNVGSVVFYYSANSGNSSATAYLLSSSTEASKGSATWSQVSLKSGVGEIAQGVSLGTSGTFTFNLASTETGAKFYGIVIVTSSFKRMTGGTITIKEGATGGGGSTPSIDYSSSLTAFGYTDGVPSAPQSFTVSGSNLTANLTVTAPNNYEVCATENGTYSSSVSFTPSDDGAVSAQTVFIRLLSNLNPGNYNYTSTSAIRLRSTDADEVDIDVEGMVPFTVRWIANNDTEHPIHTTYVAYGDIPGTAIGTVPGGPDVNDYCGDGFYGWCSEHYSDESVAPTIVTPSTLITANTTFHAVFVDYVME